MILIAIATAGRYAAPRSQHPELQIAEVGHAEAGATLGVHRPERRRQVQPVRGLGLYQRHVPLGIGARSRTIRRLREHLLPAHPSLDSADRLQSRDQLVGRALLAGISAGWSYP